MFEGDKNMSGTSQSWFYDFFFFLHNTLLKIVDFWLKFLWKTNFPIITAEQYSSLFSLL